MENMHGTDVTTVQPRKHDHHGYQHETRLMASLDENHLERSHLLNIHTTSHTERGSGGEKKRYNHLIMYHVSRLRGGTNTLMK